MKIGGHKISKGMAGAGIGGTIGGVAGGPAGAALGASAGGYVGSHTGQIFGESGNKNPYTGKVNAAGQSLEGMYGDNSAANQSVMADIMAGRPAQIDEGTYKNAVESPLMSIYNNQTTPAIKASMGKNYWSSIRQGKEQQAATDLQWQLMQGRYALQQQARAAQLQGMGMQQSALQAAMGGYGQAAQLWQPKPGLLDYLNQANNMAQQGASTGILMKAAMA